MKGAGKLNYRFYGAYKIVRCVREVTYELVLLEGYKIHNVFHVSSLKKSLGKHVVTYIELPQLDQEGELILVPEEILEVREWKLRSTTINEYLVKWKDLLVENATWEGEDVLQKLGLKLLYEKQSRAKGIVMSPSTQRDNARDLIAQ